MATSASATVTCASPVQKSKQGLKEVLEPGQADLEYIRLRTAKNEIIVAPGNSFTMVIIQDKIDGRVNAKATKEGEGDAK